jgi:hypothetical protein
VVCEESGLTRTEPNLLMTGGRELNDDPEECRRA